MDRLFYSIKQPASAGFLFFAEMKTLPEALQSI